MEWYEILLIVVAAVLLLGALIYLFVLIRPRKYRHIDSTLLTSYAHRGLHGNGIPENSLAAFSQACEAGYGIELDVQLSKDGEVMVFHDNTLIRMTGREEKLSDLTASELATLRLADTDQTIPTFTEVLKLVDGRVPLLIELKGENLDTSLCEKLANILASYRGAYCIESFNPLLLRSMQTYLPNVFYGLLYTNTCREKGKRTLLYTALTAMCMNCVARPHFIAYDYRERDSLPVVIATKFYKAPRFVWTVRDADELAKACALGEYPIFEGMKT